MNYIRLSVPLVAVLAALACGDCGGDTVSGDSCETNDDCKAGQ